MGVGVSVLSNVEKILDFSVWPFDGLFKIAGWIDSNISEALSFLVVILLAFPVIFLVGVTLPFVVVALLLYLVLATFHDLFKALIRGFKNDQG